MKIKNNQLAYNWPSSQKFIFKKESLGKECALVGHELRTDKEGIYAK